MLQTGNIQRIEEPTLVVEKLSAAEFYAECIGFLRRRGYIIALAVLLGVALAALYIIVTPPYYTGRATLIVDAPRTQFFQAQSMPGESATLIDSATVDTQIQILTSDDLALAVIHDLRLNEDQEFVSPPSGIFGTIYTYTTHGVASALETVFPAVANSYFGQVAPDDRALATFQRRLKVERVGLTYALAINFQSPSPYRAAQIANALADAYEIAAFQAKYQIAGRSAKWLEDRLTQLREQASNAERAVVNYKAENNIVDTGGRLMNEQQLAELNSDLVQARAATAAAKARFDRVDKIIGSDTFDPESAASATVSDTLHNDVITKLRTQYLDDERRASDWAAKYGNQHAAVANLRNEMNSIRHSIFEELQRTAESYKSDLAIAQAQENSIQDSLDRIIANSNATDNAKVTLHDLQSSAQTYRDIYDNFLQRYTQSVQQQSSPVAEARLINHARVPLNKTGPKTFIVLVLASLGGLIFGAAISTWRDIADRVFRTTLQVCERLQADCIAVVPRVEEAAILSRPFERAHPALPVLADASMRQSRGLITLLQNVFGPTARSIRAGVGLLLPGFPRVGPGLVTSSNARRRRRRRRMLTRDKSVCWTVANSPFSRFSESIRAVKVAADSSDRATKTIGITSSLPDEGKSTLALSLAAIIAQGNRKAILVDCDIRNPALSEMLTPDAKAGFLDVISGAASLDDVLWREPISGLAFLPAVPSARISHSSDVLASQKTRDLLEQLRASYDYVIIDLSPLAPVVDARVMVPLVDSFILIVEWGRTKIDVAQLALDHVRKVGDNLLGIVLNKADMKTFGRYANVYESYYNNDHYARYGYTD